MIAIRFHHVFGLSIETVQSQPVLGWKDEEEIDDAQVYFFEGFIINIPFIKIMIGDVYDVFEQILSSENFRGYKAPFFFMAQD